MGSKAGNWEGLRKQARALENEIDMKLVSFSKLGTNYTARSNNTDSDKQPLLGGAESGLESLERDLESLLSQLSAINDEMAGYAAGAGDARSAAIHHTLQRHSEILQVSQVPGLSVSQFVLCRITSKSSARPPTTLPACWREKNCSVQSSQTFLTTGTNPGTARGIRRLTVFSGSWNTPGSAEKRVCGGVELEKIFAGTPRD